MIHELRIYRVTPGRMGDALARFRKLPPLFQKHGLRCLGRWQALSGADGPAFVYLLAHRDFTERDERWGAFYRDEAWLRLRAESNAGEEMVERFDLMLLKPNAMWNPGDTPQDAVLDGAHELRIFQVGAGQAQRASHLLCDVMLPITEKLGGTTMLMADVLTGGQLPEMATFTRWPDVGAWREARLRIEHDPRLSKALRDQRADDAGMALGLSRSWLLDPVDDPLPRHILKLSQAEEL